MSAAVQFMAFYFVIVSRIKQKDLQLKVYRLSAYKFTLVLLSGILSKLVLKSFLNGKKNYLRVATKIECGKHKFMFYHAQVIKLRLKCDVKTC